MGEALAEAQLRRSTRARPDWRRGGRQRCDGGPGPRQGPGNQRSHATPLIVALREAARKLGRDRLADATVLRHPRAMPDVRRALLACDVEALVFAVSNSVDTARQGGAVQLAQTHGCRTSSRS